jgi:hypothetical protein
MAIGDTCEQARARHQPPVLGGWRAAAGLAFEFVLVFRHALDHLATHGFDIRRVGVPSSGSSSASRP